MYGSNAIKCSIAYHSLLSSTVIYSAVMGAYPGRCRGLIVSWRLFMVGVYACINIVYLCLSGISVPYACLWILNLHTCVCTLAYPWVYSYTFNTVHVSYPSTLNHPSQPCPMWSRSCLPMNTRLPG